jgi:hypothetical protein
LGGNTKALLAFLNEWGAWCSPYDHRTSWDGPSCPETWRPEQIWERQAQFRAAPRDPVKWLSNPATAIIATSTQNEFPFQMCLVSGCEYAIRMSITFDLLRKVKYRFCKLCNAPFAVTDPRKIFCGEACGHLSSTRSQRKKRRKSKGATHA